MQIPLQQIQHCCQILDGKKAENIRLLNVTAISPITDYLILATGNSEPHLKALCATLEQSFKENEIDVIGVQRDPQSGWVVIDTFDFMTHLFLPDKRDYYNLDSLWNDAEEIDWYVS